MNPDPHEIKWIQDSCWTGFPVENIVAWVMPFSPSFFTVLTHDLTVGWQKHLFWQDLPELSSNDAAFDSHSFSPDQTLSRDRDTGKVCEMCRRTDVVGIYIFPSFFSRCIMNFKTKRAKTKIFMKV
jgi:hypothetical protein